MMARWTSPNDDCWGSLSHERPSAVDTTCDLDDDISRLPVASRCDGWISRRHSRGDVWWRDRSGNANGDRNFHDAAGLERHGSGSLLGGGRSGCRHDSGCAGSGLVREINWKKTRGDSFERQGNRHFGSVRVPLCQHGIASARLAVICPRSVVVCCQSNRALA